MSISSLEKPNCHQVPLSKLSLRYGNLISDKSKLDSKGNLELGFIIDSSQWGAPKDHRSSALQGARIGQPVRVGFQAGVACLQPAAVVDSILRIWSGNCDYFLQGFMGSFICFIKLHSHLKRESKTPESFSSCNNDLCRCS